jgi:hypothetical protein
VEWAKYVGFFSLFIIQLSPIQPLVKDLLQDLFTSTKLKVSRDNIKLGVAQIIYSMLRICFLVDLTFVVLNCEKEDESVAKVPLKIQAIGGTKILGTHFRFTLIDLDKEINDIEEVDSMNIQLETSRQSKIPPTFITALQSWNLRQHYL